MGCSHPDSISNLYSADILNYVYWSKKSKFIYGLIDSNGFYFETDIIYRKKKDLQSLISSLPTI